MLFQTKIDISIQYLKRLQIVDIANIVKTILGAKKEVATLYEKYEQSGLDYLIKLIVSCEKEEAQDIAAQIQDAMRVVSEKTMISVEDFVVEEPHVLV